MAIDSLQRRSTSLTAGWAPSAGLHAPNASGINTAFERGGILANYLPSDAGDVGSATFWPDRRRRFIAMQMFRRRRER